MTGVRACFVFAVALLLVACDVPDARPRVTRGPVRGLVGRVVHDLEGRRVAKPLTWVDHAAIDVRHEAARRRDEL